MVGYRDPTNADAEWHNSLPVEKTNNADEQIELSIGNGNVQFETQIQASAGSVDCQKAPSTTFGVPQPLDQIGGTHPKWPS